VKYNLVQASPTGDWVTNFANSVLDFKMLLAQAGGEGA